MKLNISELKFQMPSNLMQSEIKKLDRLTKDLKLLSSKAGTENKKFNRAYSAMTNVIRDKTSITKALNEPIKIRALAILLQSKWSQNINLTQSILDRIDELKPSPSSLLIQSIYQYYLVEYNRVNNYKIISLWLIVAMKKRGMYKRFHSDLLGFNGPKWLAKKCISNKRDFSNQLNIFELDNYASGQFLTLAKKIYFVEQLKAIPVNKPHDLLQEVQVKSTYEAHYNNKLLLGHKVLQILIEKAPDTGIDDSWLNVVMAIAGDPRIPKSHPKYIKWWFYLDKKLIHKVKGWLSRLDLRLFLEALENYSFQYGKDELKRMFPSRKNFLEGLHDRKMITHTRLYLSSGADAFLRKNYKTEHLPQYSKISDGDKSIIHVQLGDSHIIEGSHSCYLWIYEGMHESSIVFDYERKYVSYNSLTQGLSNQMRSKGTPHLINITHSPVNFNWQHKAIKSLNRINIDISAQDVLSTKDYQHYKRYHGVY